MARARNIKPAFFKNEQLVELAMATRLLFIGLWCLADREGRLEDRPKRIKMEIFPGDSIDVDKALDELDREAFIKRYEVGAERYIQVLNFKKHQNPHHREPPSTIPPPGASPGPKPDPKQAEPEAAGASQGTAAQGEPRASPADSGFLNPETGEKALSGGAPDGQGSPAEKRKEAKAIAERVLAYLNEKAGTKYRGSEPHLRLMAARVLQDQATEGEMRAVADAKVKEWGADPEKRRYLSPDTLFNATKYAKYAGQLAIGAAPAQKLEVKAYAERADGTRELVITYQANGLQAEAAARQILAQHQRRFEQAHAKNIVLDNGRNSATFSLQELGSR